MGVWLVINVVHSTPLFFSPFHPINGSNKSAPYGGPSQKIRVGFFKLEKEERFITIFNYQKKGPLT